MDNIGDHSCSIVQRFRTRASIIFARLAIAFTLVLSAVTVVADNSYHDLAKGPLEQDWSDKGLITANHDWSGVHSIMGYRGDALVNTDGADPRTILAECSPTLTNVLANKTNPNTLSDGGVAEFDGIADPAVGLQGSGTADAPILLFHLCTTGMTQIRVRYDLRDIDGSTDNAIQPVALQYRVGTNGNFVNVPGAFVADATTGPGLATNVIRVDAVLPAVADDQPRVQVRVITANAVSSDEWVGVDNIMVNGIPLTAVAPPEAREDGSCSIECQTRIGWNYRLQRSTDLVTWVDVGNSLAGDGFSHQFSDYPVGAMTFWRVEIQ